MSGWGVDRLSTAVTAVSLTAVRVEAGGGCAGAAWLSRCSRNTLGERREAGMPRVPTPHGGAGRESVGLQLTALPSSGPHGHLSGREGNGALAATRSPIDCRAYRHRRAQVRLMSVPG
eukprot:356953-Chlamydomonas_euryale.AAC.9